MLLAVMAWSLPLSARAYPWMIKHQYFGCGTCHADPSGGGLLTAYGRAQSEILMRMPYGRSPEEEPRYAGFLFGLVNLPDWLLASLSFRGAEFGLWSQNPDGSTMTDLRFIMMLLDARAMLKLGAFRAGGSLGWGNTIVTTPAAVFTSNDGTQQLLSRDYWVGLALDDERVLLRLGRINVPYGLRNVEHTSWVRSLTGTDINISQQTGLAASYATGNFRTEWLLMLGNLRATDTGYREQGFSGYAELRVASRAAVGLSALVGRGHSFVAGQTDYLRQNYGAFVRWAPIVPVTFLLEGNVFFKNSFGSGQTIPNGVGWLQVDWEPTQGLHILPAAEILKAQNTNGVATGWWLTLDWYFLPHTDLRLDGVWRDYPAQGGRQQVLSWLIQLHVFL